MRTFETKQCLFTEGMVLVQMLQMTECFLFEDTVAKWLNSHTWMSDFEILRHVDK